MVVEFDLRPHIREYFAPRFDRLVQIQEEPRALDEFKELMAREGRPIVYANHHGWGDGWAMARVTQRLRELTANEGIDFPGVVMPIARTISTGHYGAPLRYIYNLFDSVLEKRGLLTTPYTREKDTQNFGLKRPAGETLRVARALGKDYGIAFFPEASVQGGRHKRGILGFVFGGEINGMINISDPNYFSSFYELMNRFGNVKGEIFFMPVALNGSYRFFGADIPIPTWELMLSLAKDSTNPVNVTIGRPITVLRLIEELGEDWQSDGKLLSDFLMKQVAGKLPTQARGVYREALELKMAV